MCVKIFTFKMFESKLDRIIQLLELQIKEQKKMSDQIDTWMQDLVNAVTAESTVVDGVVLTLQEVVAKLETLINQSNLSDADKAAALALTATVNANATKLGNAVAEVPPEALP